ncbi:uncharacterized protein L969DRAFT_65976 [Mixia osmundae IAM 14324]|uniref:Uncharacterized protein n=1 Tax=Mixia osmundae (strain CBS 9802 / IAM 14324 / JCM 22182 / KY 12970) TaxID=764103 RepID=G7DWJ3_MIXOS|nr:uncharacterized protein L969DRAFT_65976 [Mixia osmundae IAM 14324]KEI37354.1 hypothetical protein L969DRAFT_65976 [Mixia osmundae IAM 14324]GAA94953.1 hypothetical protein E5Q_01608 [Mixia osmundae IAM 14324]
MRGASDGLPCICGGSLRLEASLLSMPGRRASTKDMTSPATRKSMRSVAASSSALSRISPSISPWRPLTVQSQTLGVASSVSKAERPPVCGISRSFSTSKSVSRSPTMRMLGSPSVRTRLTNLTFYTAAVMAIITVSASVLPCPARHTAQNDASTSKEDSAPAFYPAPQVSGFPSCAMVKLSAIVAAAAFAGYAAAAPAAAATTAKPDPNSAIGSILGAARLLNNISVFIPVDTAPQDNLVQASFFVNNPLAKNGILNEDLYLNSIKATASVNKTVYASFSYTFKPALRVAAGKTVSSPVIPNVKLVQGFDNSLGLLDAFGGPVGYFDVASIINATAKSSLLFGAISAPTTLQLNYNEKNVTTYFNFE